MCHLTTYKERKYIKERKEKLTCGVLLYSFLLLYSSIRQIGKIKKSPMTTAVIISSGSDFTNSEINQTDNAVKSNALTMYIKRCNIHFIILVIKKKGRGRKGKCL